MGSRGLPGRPSASCFPPTKGQWLFLARASKHRTLSIKLTMILWRLTLLSCFLLLAAAFPFHESTSSSPGVQPRPGPHHSLATLLYSVVVQDEAEDADISALPRSEIQDWTNIS